MYTYIKSQCLPNDLDAVWVYPDLSQIPVYQIYRTYREVYIELSHPSLTNNIIIPFHDLRVEYLNYTDTLEQWLIDIDSKTLPTVDSFPSTRLYRVRYEDLNRLDYNIEPCKLGYNLPSNYPAIDLPDLRLSRQNTIMDNSLVDQYGLITVNGYLHLTTHDNNYTYVIDGYRNSRYAREAHIGLLSFYQIGELIKLPIETTMLSKIDSISPYYKGVYITVPSDYDVSNKTIWLSLGGYMIPIDEYVWYPVGNQTYRLNLNFTPYIERLFETIHFIDLKTLFGLDKDSFSTDWVTSNDFIVDYLCNFINSFLIIIDTPYLNIRKHHIRKHTIPGYYLSYNEPYYPMVTGYGKLAEYWRVYEDGVWSVNIVNGYDRDMLKFTYDSGNIEIGKLKPLNANKTSRGVLLEIYTTG